MTVLLVHRNDFGPGGGNIAMARLHRGLKKAGVDSRILCGSRSHDAAGDDRRPEPWEVEVIPRGFLVRRVERVLERALRPVGLNDLHAVSSFRIPVLEAYREADVLDFHCIHGGFFNLLALPRLVRGKAAVMTLHDMWPLTGHCHNSLDCERWRSGCGDCPYLEIEPAVERDATALEWRLKDWIYGRCDLQVVAPSRWLGRIAEESVLGRFPVTVIPHGVDLQVFRPDGRERKRRELGIPDDRTVLMTGARDLRSPLKGVDLLLKALHRLPGDVRRDVLLLLMGRRADELQAAAPVETRATGYVSKPEEAAAVYAAADVFVHPSRAENYPLVLVESTACGTPMVAFAVGGVAELVRPGETGVLADPEDIGELAEGITRLHRDPELRRRMSRTCRARAEERHSIDRQVRDYLDVYRAALMLNQAA